MNHLHNIPATSLDEVIANSAPLVHPGASPRTTELITLIKALHIDKIPVHRVYTIALESPALTNTDKTHMIFQFAGKDLFSADPNTLGQVLRNILYNK